MSKGNITENDLVKFYFNNVAMPSYGSNLYLALHIADPGEGGDQTQETLAITLGYLYHEMLVVGRFLAIRLGMPH
jgi:hypothetical protein